MEDPVLKSNLLMESIKQLHQAVDNFVYLGDCICRDGCCELATIKRCRSAWGNLRKLTLAYL